MPTLGLVTGVAVLKSGVTLMARVLGQAGTPVTRASLTSLSYTVRNLTTASTVAANVPLTVSQVVYDALVQDDPRWDKDGRTAPGRDGRFGYNFLAVIPAAYFTGYTVDSAAPYRVTAHRYQVDVLFTPVSGEPFVQPFQFTALPAYTA